MVRNGLNYLKFEVVCLYTFLCLSGFMSISKCMSAICEHECASRLSLVCSTGGTADCVLQSEWWVGDLPRIAIMYSAGREAKCTVYWVRWRDLNVSVTAMLVWGKHRWVEGLSESLLWLSHVYTQTHTHTHTGRILQESTDTVHQHKVYMPVNNFY